MTIAPRRRACRRLPALLLALAVGTGVLADSPAYAADDAHLTGTVTAPSGEGIEGVQVSAFRYDEAGEHWDTARIAITDASGDYDVTGLAAGTYRLGFTSSSAEHIDEYYDDVDRLGLAEDISVAAGMTVGGRDAELAAASHLTGTVTGPGGAALAGVDVTAHRYDEQSGGWSRAGTDQTDAAGAYDVGGLAAGTYRLEFRPTSRAYAPEYHADATTLATADDLVLGDGVTLGGHDARLAAASHIAGTVTGPGGTGLGDVEVTAYVLDDQDEHWVQLATVDTGPSGAYDLGGLAAGTYRLGFRSPAHLDEYYDDARSVDDADDIVVGPETTVAGRNAQLAPAGHITGTVTGAGAAPIPGVQVTAYQWDAGDGYWRTVSWAHTDPGGAYDLDDLAPGSYRLGFGSTPGHVGEYYQDEASVETADDVVLGPGATVSGRDARLAVASHITGTVTDSSGTGLGDVGVTVYALQGGFWESVARGSTDASGTYDVGGLAAGTYRLRFWPDSPTHLPEYYDDRATLDTSHDVVVGAGTTVSGRDARLATAGHITGTVTGTDGSGLGDVRVIAYEYDEQAEYWRVVESAYTDLSGDYDIGGLAADTYRLEFRPGSPEHLGEYYDDESRVVAADDVVVGPGATVSGRDATLSPGSHVTGTVTGDDGSGLADVRVVARRYDEQDDWWEIVQSTYTTGSGDYDLSGLSPGAYRLEFDPDSPQLLGEFFHDKATLDAADDVVVGADTTVTDLDARLAPASHITGTVTDTTGNPLADVEVTAYRDVGGDEWDSVAWTGTDASGHYDLGGLAPDTYRLRFSPSTSAQVGEYYRDQATLSAADEIVVGTNATVTGRDAQLATASHITGTVTGPGGTGIDDVEVRAYRYDGGDDGWSQVRSTRTDATGRYDLAGLSAGTFRLQFVPDSSDHLGEYFNDRATLLGADDVVLGAGATVSGRNARLAAASHVTGTVTGPSGSAAADVRVTAFRHGADGWESVGSTYTGPSGDYDLGGLAAGTYRLRFAPESPAYAPEYYRDQATLDAADDIVVAASATVGGRDAQLAAASHITGTVTGPAGTLLEGIEVVAMQLLDGEWSDVGYAYTDLSGDYDLDGLAAGTYRVGFFDHGPAHLAREFWNDRPEVESAQDVVVTAGATVSARSAQLATGASIAGRVTGPDGVGVESDLTAYRRTGTGAWAPYAYGSSNGAGDYLIRGLPAGSYRLEIQPYDGYAAEFYQDAATLATATDVEVAAAATVSGRHVVVAPLAGTLQSTALPTIDGTARVGQTLTATAGSWNPAPDAVTYQWLLAGSAIAHATSATYVPVAGDAGKALSVRVRATRTGWTAGEATSAATAAVAPAAQPPVVTPPVVTPPPAPQAVANTKKPSISGTTVVGQRLKASTGSWSPGSVTLAVRWFADGTVIRGATTTTLKLKAAQVGARITVVVTASASGRTPATATSKATAKVRAKKGRKGRTGRDAARPVVLPERVPVG